MKKFLIIILLFIPTIGFAQTVQQINQAIANAQSCINNNAQSTTTSNAQLLQDKQELLTLTSQNAQTASQVNWDYVVGLELSGINYTQWSAAQTNVNWTAIVPTLGVGGTGCQVTEKSVNWTNWFTCEANGVSGGQPYGNWPTGIGAFWCGKGSILGTR